MSIFPEISHITQLYENVKHISEIRFTKHVNGFTTVCYMLSDEDTFHGEGSAWARECRGIMFDENGKIASRPLHKFMNLNECAETHETKIDFSKTTRAMRKMDGSMIHPFIYNDTVILKTKKTYTSDVAIKASVFFNGTPNYVKFCKALLKNGFTPIFEYTAPNSRIVVPYQEETLTLLHIRNNITGEYHTRAELVEVSQQYDIKLVEEAYDLLSAPEILTELKRRMTEEQLQEGYVLQFEDGNMLKAKTDWYRALHNIVTFPTFRGVAKLILDETIDDFKAHLMTAGDYSDMFNEITKIEQHIVQRINEIRAEVELQYNQNKELDKKSFAIKLNRHEFFGLIMALYIGREPNYVEFYEKRFLKEDFKPDQI